LIDITGKGLHLKNKVKQANALRGAVYFEFAATFIIIVFTLLLLVHFAFKFLALSLAYDLTTELLAVVKQTDLGVSGGSNLTFHINPINPGTQQSGQRSCVCSNYSNQEVICKKFCNLVKGQQFISALVRLVTVTITTHDITTSEPNTSPRLTGVQVTGSYQSEFDVFRFLSSSTLNNFNVTLRGVL
jgi:hypothetical protein